ncbi:MAG: DUF2339 domain-containing protein [Elusimicrobiota bacterium]|nr:DUF2339 domain-containing protein [Elusimicrobiota bacterium]
MEESEEDLRAAVRELRAELRGLRDEVAALKGAKVASAAPAPAPAGPAAPEKSLAAKTYSLLTGWLLESAPMAPPKNPAVKAGPLAKKAEPAPPAKPAASWTLDEKFVGEKVLQYAGMVVLALGVAFFLVWRAAHTGPAERVFMASVAGAALIGLGLRLRDDARFREFAQTLVGGGWTVLYVTAYAAYHFPPTKILDSAAVGLGVLGVVAFGMVGHALSTGSRPFRLYAFGLTYFVFFFCREEVTSFDLFLLLHAACVLVAAETGEADVLLVSLAGFHASYLPVYFDFMRAPQSHALSEFMRVMAWQGAAYALVAALPFVPKARGNLLSSGQEKLFDAALTLNGLAFGFFGATLGRAYFGTVSLARAAVLSACYTVPGLFYLKLLPKRSTAAGLCGALGLAVLAAAAFDMPDPTWKLVAWAGISCGWVWLGLFFDAPVWRAAGLLMALLTFGFYFNLAARGPVERTAASAAMFVFSGLSYLYARFYRVWLGDADEWEKPAGEAWLYAGTAALLLGLWGVLDAAPFVCALVALCVAGELLAVKLPRLHLWVQASVLELGLGVYSLFVDYGTNLPVAGVSARLLVTAVMVAGWAYLYLEDPMDEALSSKWKRWSRAEQRRLMTWVALAAVSFAAYKEFDGFLRLPIWAFGSAALYLAGRSTRATHFKQQGLALALGTAAEAVLTYVTAPSVLGGGPTGGQTAFYWLSCLALLGMVAVAKDRRWGAPTGLDEQSATLLSVVSLVLMAAYCGKELDAVKLTMAWTALGTAYLLAGLTLGWRELRMPALALLGVCVGKALLLDTSRMPLPYRVATFVGLGVVLLGGSSLYVRLENEEDPPASGDA